MIPFKSIVPTRLPAMTRHPFPFAIPDEDRWNIFRGFNVYAFLGMLSLALSGLSFGYVMKFADNITRLFIISSAMIVTTVMAMVIFDLHANIYFVSSFLLVTLSMFLYHR